MPRAANKFPKTITVPLEAWMHKAILEAADANDREPEQEIRARLREGLEPPAAAKGICRNPICNAPAKYGSWCNAHAFQVDAESESPGKMSLGD